MRLPYLRYAHPIIFETTTSLQFYIQGAGNMGTASSAVFKYFPEPMSVPRAKALVKIAADVNERGTPFNAADMKEP